MIWNKEALDQIMETHSPGMRKTNLEKRRQLTSKKVLWVINSFKTYKTAGTYEIIPAMLHKAYDILALRSVRIYKICRIMWYVPEKCKKVTMFLKQGKRVTINRKTIE